MRGPVPLPPLGKTYHRQKSPELPQLTSVGSSVLATHKLPQYRLAGNGPCGLCWKLLCVLGSGLGLPEYFITDGFIRVYLVFNTGLDGSRFFCLFVY